MITGILGSTILALMALASAYVVIRTWREIKWSARANGVLFVLALMAVTHRMLFVQLCEHRLGGLAEFGKVDGGHFFVGNHGKYREVTPQIYRSNLAYDRFSELLGEGLTLMLVISLLAHGFFRKPRPQWSLYGILRPGEAAKSNVGTGKQDTNRPPESRQ